MPKKRLSRQTDKEQNDKGKEKLEELDGKGKGVHKPLRPTGSVDLQNKRLKGLTEIYEVAEEQSFDLLDTKEFQAYFEGHWRLLIFCHFGEPLESDTCPSCMLLLDSLIKAGAETIINDIYKFVIDIFNAEERDDEEDMINSIPVFVPQVPQQKGGEECGYFVLYYMYKFIQSALDEFNPDGYPYFLTGSWFSLADVEAFQSGLLRGVLIYGAPSHNGEGVKPTTQARKSQGSTLCNHVHGMLEGQKINVDLNSLTQPVGHGARIFRSFLGTLARNYDKFPIDFEDWRRIPNTYKDDVWEYIKRKFDVEDCVKTWIRNGDLGRENLERSILIQS